MKKGFIRIIYTIINIQFENLTIRKEILHKKKCARKLGI